MREWPDTVWNGRRSITAAATWLSVGLNLPVSGQVSEQVAGRAEIPKLIVNEVFFRGKDTDLEFVELFNASAGSIDLATLQFSDSRHKPVSVSNGPYPLGQGGYAVITRNGTAFDARFTFPPRIEIRGWPALNNSGDAVILWLNDTVVDSVEYSTSWGGNDVSLERIDPAGSSTARSNWAESLDRLGGTPGQINSVFARDVSPPRLVFCEEVADGTLVVHFSEPLSPATVAPSSFRFESGAIAENASLDESKQVVLITTGPDAQGLWIAVSGVSDESGNTLAEQQIPVAWLPEPGELILNEIMYEPLANEFDGLTNQSEYVELLSVASRSLSIRSVVLTDHLRENGTRDTTALSDRRIAIEPGTFILVYAHGDPSEDPLEAFPGIDRSNPRLVLLPITASSLSFGNNGGEIRLERWGGIVVDEVEYAPSWHLAERVETRGVSLERISPRAATQNPSNWSSSANPSGGTPGGHNSIRFESGSGPESASLVIEPSPFSPDGDGFEDVALISISLGRPTAVIRVWVFDLSGRAVVELVQARPVGSSSSLIWDGRDRDGAPMHSGVYVILVEAVDVAGRYVARSKKPVALIRH